jgi:DNA-binding transcriptional ArsR family regulator
MGELEDIFHSLSDNRRLQIVQLLEQYENISVGELADALSLSSAAISQHMRVLEYAGVVRRERHGQRSCYQLQTQNPFIQDVLAIIHNSQLLYG